jgi:hypothetical protein
VSNASLNNVELDMVVLLRSDHKSIHFVYAKYAYMREGDLDDDDA